MNKRKADKQAEIRMCLNCKLSVCRGTRDCPAFQVSAKRESVKVSLLRDLLLAGYDPAEICFAAVEGTALV